MSGKKGMMWAADKGTGHRWEPGWSDISNEAVDKCMRCGLMKRTKSLFNKGTLRKYKIVTEYWKDGNWCMYTHTECKIDKNG